MQIITPIDITEDMLTSPIAEPDASQGEAAWINPNTINEFGSLTARYADAILATNGYVYGTGSSNGDVVKIDTENKTVSYFGLAPDNYSMFLVGDYIYCMSRSSGDDSLKIDTLTDTVSTISSLSSMNNGVWATSSSGDLYGVVYSNTSSSYEALKLTVFDDSLSSIATLNQNYDELLRSSGGSIYGVSSAGLQGETAIKINPETSAVTEFGSYDVAMFALSAGSDGNMYAAGNPGYILKINSETDTLETITSSTGFYVSTVTSGDYIYFCTASGRVMSFYVPGNTYTIIGDSQGGTGYYSLDIDSNGRLMAAGFSADGTTDNIMIVNTNNNEIEAIYTGYTSADEIFTDSNGDVFCITDTGISYLNDPYNLGDQVVSTVTHKVYQCVIDNTLDEPVIGSELVPPSWVELYATNKYRAFDYKINTKSYYNATIDVFEFTPLQATTTISFFGLENITRVYIQVREDDENGSLIYNSSKLMAIDSPTDDLIVNEDLLNSKVIFDDLPVYSSPHISVTFNKVSGSTFAVGDIVIGNPRTLGRMTYLSSTSRTSYDTTEIDDYGNETTISRPSAEYTTFEMVVFPQYADYVERILKDSLNKPRVYVGDKQDGEKMFTFGYYERSPISYDDPSLCTTTLKVRGLV